MANVNKWFIADVGAGLLLGGGLSFLSNQYGLACDTSKYTIILVLYWVKFQCDTVIKYEVVLASGAIINASTSSNTDMFWALKGGGNQFGMEMQSLNFRKEI
jgi:hypothetical protein